MGFFEDNENGILYRHNTRKRENLYTSYSYRSYINLEQRPQKQEQLKKWRKLRKRDLKMKNHKIVSYVLDNLDMAAFKYFHLRRASSGEYFCDREMPKDKDEVITVKFDVANTYEIFDEMGEWWGGWNDCPDSGTMKNKAQEWYDKYGAELKEISHDTLVFSCRKLSESEANALWEDICRFAPNSRDIDDEATIKERLLKDSGFTLWWD